MALQRKTTGKLVLAALAAGLYFSLPALIEPRLNKTLREPEPSFPSPYRALRVADLHADPMLWERDWLKRSSRGQTDLPRLLEGGYVLQVFGLVTQVPAPLRAVNAPEPDILKWLAPAQGWPPRTWRSPLERALYQAGKLSRFSERSEGKLVLVRTAAQLAGALKAKKLAAVLSVEGAHCLEGKLENLDKLEAAGVRMLAPTHFFDTDLAGSAHGQKAGGLTPLGARWLEEMEKRKLIVDLAHASPPTITEILAKAKRPVVVSHTGVRGTCDNKRNLSDDQLRAVAKNGGLVGIGFWDVAVCGRDAAAIARAILHAVKVMGPSHVALGSDFDGAVTTPFDAARVYLVAGELMQAGMKPDQIKAVMGENLLAFLGRALP